MLKINLTKSSSFNHKLYEIGTLLVFVFSLFLWNAPEIIRCLFQACGTDERNFQFEGSIWYSFFISGINFLLHTSNYSNISIAFVVLTAFISFLLIVWLDNDYSNVFAARVISLTELFLIITFLTKNLLVFFICFELSSLPIFYILAFHGPSFRKNKALYYFIKYTIIGSSFLLVGIFSLYSNFHTWDVNKMNTDLLLDHEKIIIWLCFFIAFSIKVPIYPFHLWLLEAHVEAPTVGSVILAALLLKVGGYGLIKYCVAFFPAVSASFAPIVVTIGLISMLYSAIGVFIQLDIKRAIAYSSISHMNAALVGLFSSTSLGIKGAIAGMIAHGFTSAGLFFLAGILYQIFHTKNTLYLSGILNRMPLFAFFLLFFSFSNAGFPGSFNFVCEVLLIIGTFQYSLIAGLYMTLGTSILFIYFIWLASFICFHQTNINYLAKARDISTKHFFILTCLLIPIVYFGFTSEIMYFLQYANFADITKL